MRSMYKSPVIWTLIATLLVFGIIGHVLSVTIESKWNYLFYGTSTKALVLAAFFVFCVLANFVGTRCKPVTVREFTDHSPTTLIAVVGCFSAGALIVVMIIGIDNPLGLGLLISAFSAVVLGIPTAFFFQGRRVPTIHDR